MCGARAHAARAARGARCSEARVDRAAAAARRLPRPGRLYRRRPRGAWVQLPGACEGPRGGDGLFNPISAPWSAWRSGSLSMGSRGLLDCRRGGQAGCWCGRARRGAGPVAPHRARARHACAASLPRGRPPLPPPAVPGLGARPGARPGGTHKHRVAQARCTSTLAWDDSELPFIHNHPLHCLACRQCCRAPRMLGAAARQATASRPAGRRPRARPLLAACTLAGPLRVGAMYARARPPRGRSHSSRALQQPRTTRALAHASAGACRAGGGAAWTARAAMGRGRSSRPGVTRALAGARARPPAHPLPCARPLLGH